MKKRAICVLLCVLMALPVGVFAQPGDHPDYSTASGWALSDMEEAYRQEILDPYMARDFGSAISREDFCTLCANVLMKWYGLSEYRDIENVEELKERLGKSSFEGFSDSSDVYNIEICTRLGIISGMGDGTFHPKDPITREQAALMLCNTLSLTPVLKEYEGDSENGVNGIFLPHVFDDLTDIDPWARDSVFTVYHLGIMLGDAKNRFDPLGTYTKEQAVSTVLRLYKAYAAPDEVKKPDPELYPSADNPLIGSGTYYSIDSTHLWTEEFKKSYEPVYYDGFGNEYTAKEKGYVYPPGASYMEVSKTQGTGVKTYSVIDKDKNEPIKGYDTIIGISGDKAIVLDYGQTALVDLSTGEVLRSFYPGTLVEYVGGGMFKYLDENGAGYMDESFNTVFPPEYKNLEQRFLNGYCIFQKSDDSFVIVNSKGESFKSFRLDLNRYNVNSVCGTNMILMDKQTDRCVLYRASSEEYIRDYVYLNFNEAGDIEAQKGDYYLLDRNGKVVIDAKSKGFDYMNTVCGRFIFACGVDKSNWSYTAPYSVMNRNGREIISVNLNTGDAGTWDYCMGFIAYRDKPNHIVIFDDKSICGEILIPSAEISSFKFINGLLDVTLADGECRYYTVKGEEAVKTAWTNKEEK